MNEIVEKKRATPYLCAYLVLRQGNEVLMLLRKNTGYLDGYYGLVAGHVDVGESAMTAMVREAYEEAGIQIAIEDLRVVHVAHTQTARENLNIFFECTHWEGDVYNKEPDKCGALEFWPLSALPENTIEHVREVLSALQEKQFYSESGWR